MNVSKDDILFRGKLVLALWKFNVLKSLEKFQTDPKEIVSGMCVSHSTLNFSDARCIVSGFLFPRDRSAAKWPVIPVYGNCQYRHRIGLNGLWSAFEIPLQSSIWNVGIIETQCFFISSIRCMLNLLQNNFRLPAIQQKKNEKILSLFQVFPTWMFIWRCIFFLNTC